MAKKRSECDCHCHTFGGKHIVPCCFEDTMAVAQDTAQPEPEWTSVNDEMPALDYPVFVRDEFGVFIARWTGIYWDDYDGTDDEGVSHWMPIPFPSQWRSKKVEDYVDSLRSQ